VPGRRLSIEEREELSRGLVAKESLRSIAGRLGRPASTLSREVARNGGMARYRAARAHRAAHARARRPKEHKLARHRDLARAVEGGLETRWSRSRPRTWCIEPSRGGPRGGVGGAAATV